MDCHLVSMLFEVLISVIWQESDVFGCSLEKDPSGRFFNVLVLSIGPQTNHSWAWRRAYSRALNNNQYSIIINFLYIQCIQCSPITDLVIR